MDLSRRVFLLAGAGGSLAEHLGRELLAAGAGLALVARGGKAVEARERLGGGLALEADLLDGEQSVAAVREAVARLGRLDGVIHAVGGFEAGRVVDAGPAALERMLAVNLLTLANIVHAALPELLSSEDGFLGAVSAGQAHRGAGPGAAAYTASKAALGAYLRSLDGELGGTSLRVGIVYPMGAIDTPANRVAMPAADPGRWIDPREVARAMVFMATRPAGGRVLEVAVHPPRG